jgi:hypothetical protein
LDLNWLRSPGRESREAWDKDRALMEATTKQLQSNLDTLQNQNVRFAMQTSEMTPGRTAARSKRTEIKS